MGRVSRGKHAELEAFWRFHHDERARGRLNQREYCELHGLPLKRFGNWRAQFKGETKVRKSGLLYRRGGRATPALIAHVLVSKYADYLPLYRQAKIFARHGVELERSTLAGWVGGACWGLDALYDRLGHHVFASDHVFADDTPIPVLDPGRGRTKMGRLWVYARDQQGWSGPELPAAICYYEPDRKAERPRAHLAGYRGTLHVDGYAGFEQLTAGGKISLAGCWAHTRRKFYEIAKADGASIALETVQRIAELYAIETRIRVRSTVGKASAASRMMVASSSTQTGRARHPPRRTWPQEPPVRRPRRRRQALGSHRLASRNRETQRCRAARLALRRSRLHGQWPSRQPARRPPPMELENCPHLTYVQVPDAYADAGMPDPGMHLGYEPATSAEQSVKHLGRSLCLSV